MFVFEIREINQWFGKFIDIIHNSVAGRIDPAINKRKILYLIEI